MHPQSHSVDSQVRKAIHVTLTAFFACAMSLGKCLVEITISKGRRGRSRPSEPSGMALDGARSRRRNGVRIVPIQQVSAALTQRSAETRISGNELFKLPPEVPDGHRLISVDCRIRRKMRNGSAHVSVTRAPRIVEEVFVHR